MQAMESHQNNAGNNGASGSKRQQTRHKGQDEEFTNCLREYMVLSEAFHTTMSFKDFCTIKHPEWYEPQVSVDKKVKVPRKKVLVSEDLMLLKLRMMDTTTSSTPLALSYEAHNTSAHDGQVDGAHGEVSQSTDVEDSTSYLSSDAHDDEGV
jgi:hypothetical protein